MRALLALACSALWPLSSLAALVSGYNITSDSVSAGGTNMVALSGSTVTIGQLGVGYAIPNHARGMLVLSNALNTQNFSATPTQITNWTRAWSGNRLIGGSVTNGTLVLTNAGTYVLNFGCSFTITGASTITGEIYLDAAGTGIRFQKQTGGGSDTEVLRIQGLSAVTAGQTMTVRLSTATGTQDCVFRCGSMNAFQLPD